MRLNAPKFWQQPSFLAYLLLPISWLYSFIISCRRFCYRQKLFSVDRFKVPVIVVGNISVGGTGKTPFVIWLIEYLRQQGFRPGVVSRGYGSSAISYPVEVTAATTASLAGDEPVLIVKRTNCPLVVAPRRVLAVQRLLQHYACDVVISDDGLQHYALARDVEICLVDAERQFGNGWCLPAGPLREPMSRLATVDMVVVNGKDMQLQAEQLINLNTKQTSGLTAWRGRQVHAVAGIGNPERFFASLEQLGLRVIAHAFPDHHRYTLADISFNDDLPVIMTEKDAVKCDEFATEQHWYLPVTPRVASATKETLDNLIKAWRMNDGKTTHT